MQFVYDLFVPFIPFILSHLSISIEISIRRFKLRNFTFINLRPRPIIHKGIMFHGRRTLTFNILCCLVLKTEHLRTSLQQQRCAAWQTAAAGGLAWQPREATATVDSDGGGRARSREQAAAVVGGPRRARGRGHGACARRGRGIGWVTTGGGYRRRGAGAGRERHDGVGGGMGGGCSEERERKIEERGLLAPRRRLFRIIPVGQRTRPTGVT
jgi:hypothetical protein